MTTSLNDYLALWWSGEIRLPEAELIAWTRRQRLLPLLGWRADQEGWDFPEALTEAIRRSRLAMAANQALTHRQLKALGDIAEQLSIPIILVKGAAAAEAYPEPWMRPYGDIDLLIREADAAVFLQTLKGQGYTYAESTEGHRAWHFPALFPPRPGARIEIHTALARERNRVLFTVAQWQEGLRPVRIHPGLAAPSPVDHVLYLVHHAVIHHGLEMGLQGCADIGFWTQSWTGADWKLLEVKAYEARLGNAVALFLGLTGWFWGSSYPAPMTGFSPPPPILLGKAAEAMGRIVASEKLPHVWRDLPDQDQGGVFSYLRTIALGDPAQLRELSARERLRFHLRRPGELVRSHGSSLWQLIKGDPKVRAAWRGQRDLQMWLREE